MASSSTRPDLIACCAARYLNRVTEEERTLVQREHARRKIADIILAATIAIKRARAERRKFAAEEHRLITCAEYHVRRGAPLPARFAPIRLSRQRTHRTLLSLADPGRGHLQVTLRDADLLDGVVVHHEVIARGAAKSASRLPPYRMVDIRQNGVVRLHAADDVPVSVYRGRPAYLLPTWKGTKSKDWTVAATYETDPVTPCNLAAAAASAAFANGVADAKFNFDELTVTQAIHLMSQVRRAVDRNALQTLSTQFSLDVPIRDDRRRRAIKVSRPEDIAALSIEITCDGGWDRVTLDSASQTIPTTPLVDVLKAGALAEWTQEAHTRGLETYISGGIRSAQHIEAAVRAGVDGIGIGTWIHRSGRPGLPGPLDPQRVREAIRIRNEAEAC